MISGFEDLVGRAVLLARRQPAEFDLRADEAGEGSQEGLPAERMSWAAPSDRARSPSHREDNRPFHRARRPSWRSPRLHLSTDGAIDAAVVAIGWDWAPIWADTETNPNASIHTVTIVAKAIVKGR
jgi:hypothetical protein